MKRHRRERIELDDLQAFRARTAAVVTVSSAAGGRLVDCREPVNGRYRSEEQMTRDLAASAMDG
jgi:hypothetical protein